MYVKCNRSDVTCAVQSVKQTKETLSFGLSSAHSGPLRKIWLRWWRLTSEVRVCNVSAMYLFQISTKTSMVIRYSMQSTQFTVYYDGLQYSFYAIFICTLLYRILLLCECVKMCVGMCVCVTLACCSQALSLKTRPSINKALTHLYLQTVG